MRSNVCAFPRCISFLKDKRWTSEISSLYQDFSYIQECFILKKIHVWGGWIVHSSGLTEEDLSWIGIREIYLSYLAFNSARCLICRT